jgi:hypothetical protein
MTIILTPTGLSTLTLQSYITDAQRLLHDSTYQFYNPDELTDYANKARRKVAAETGCNRQLIKSFPITIGINNLSFLDMIPGRRITGILDFYLWYSDTTRYALRYFPYSQFSRTGTVVYSYNGPPTMWSQMPLNVFFSPVPAQAYNADFDVSVEPLDLIAVDDVDLEVFSPFSECVKFYMCYLAKLKDQRRQQAEEFLLDYVRERNSVMSSTMIRKLVGS